MSTQPQEIFLKDYQALDFEIESVDLTFELDPAETLVTNKMQFVRKTNQTTLKLDGEYLILVSLEKNGVLLSEGDYEQTDTALNLECPEERFELIVKTQINPEANTRLEGLYRSSGNYCTQCEAEGFRTITYYLDRPDCLSYFTTKIIGDEQANKVLLSNGNLVDFGKLEGGKHFAVWEDPHKKPCYLFALVAGNLEVVEDHFETKDARRVDLRLYVQANNLDKCDHAMTSLKKSMKWDEDRFGLVYDLDVYMIVAVDDFNMGAMENKGLNVFNSKFVLAKPETATDVDFEGIESVIAHEYFHNWTGNRVTCRDWFQLTLKEGLTVFRDQEFTADMLSPAVKRIEDVKRLRSFQFPEDAGPMSHPIQPQSYIEMNNFYTMTVYEKGAEVVRLYQTLLGRDGFRRGMDLYFDRFDGQAVTVQDFRNAMADANGRDLSQMHHWYIQSGTPKVTVDKQYDADSKTLSLSFKQTLNGQQQHLPLLIPVVFDLLSPTTHVALSFSENGQARCSRADNGWLFELTSHNDTLVLHDVEEAAYLSLFRGFSAPILLEYACTQDELVALASFDADSFVRWESIQTLALMNLVDNVQAVEGNRAMVLSEHYAQAFESNLADTSLDLALKSLAMTLPDESYLQETLSDKGMLINPDSILAVYQFMKQAIASRFEERLEIIYQQTNCAEAYHYDKEAIAQRMLKNRCLNYLSKLPNQQHWMHAQFDAQSNMTDVFAALEAMKPYDSDQKRANLVDFYHKWQQDDLVLDKWFALQASDQSDSALDLVTSLVEHPDFHYTNPNRARSVLGVFGRMNMKGFHHVSGEGYVFLASEVLKLDKINPQVAARIVSPFTQWQRYDVARQDKMKAQLTRMVESGSLSKDVYEIVSKSLK